MFAIYSADLKLTYLIYRKLKARNIPTTQYFYMGKNRPQTSQKNEMKVTPTHKNISNTSHIKKNTNVMYKKLKFFSD